MRILEIWFESDYIYGKDENGKVYRQSLLWYPGLKGADETQRQQYSFGFDGIHWRELDEDISYESFQYDDAEPSKMQRFFLTHREINISEFAKSIGFDSSLLKKYINGMQKPTDKCEQFILTQIHKLGLELSTASF